MVIRDDLPPLHRAQTRSFGRAALTAYMTPSRSSSRPRRSTDEGISTLPSAGLLFEHSTDDANAADGTAQMAHTSLAAELRCNKQLSRARKARGREKFGALARPTGSFEVRMPHPSPPLHSHARFLRSPVLPSSPPFHFGADAPSPAGRDVRLLPRPRVPRSPCETFIQPTDAECVDSLRLSTWVANRAFSDLADHDVCPTCRARALDVAAPLHCTGCSARGPAALEPATSHIVLGGASDRRSASNRTLWWHLSACNNANTTSPCHTRHAPQIAPQSESLQTHAHMRARAFDRRLTHVRSATPTRSRSPRTQPTARSMRAHTFQRLRRRCDGLPAARQAQRSYISHAAMAQGLAAQGSIA
jgi:hypothetical protein